MIANSKEFYTNFKKTKFLNEGSYGNIYEIIEVKTEKKFALK